MRRLLTLVVLATLVLFGAAVPAHAAPSTTGFTFFDLTASDGVVLKANVIAPTTPGRHPGIVFISSWGINDLEYLAQASKFAEAGYVVMSYGARGFWLSGGQIDTAGPKDVADARTAVDWMVANPAVDPDRIGTAGISYGAGISLIAAGHDPRIRAVSAMSGWSDLVYSLYDQQTRHGQSVGFLGIAALITGKPSAELTGILGDFYANRDIDNIKSWAKIRSAATYLDGINAHQPAILMANAYGDSIFPPNQLVDFYGRLTGPKRLEFAPGDHAIVEGLGLAGLPNHVWDSTRQWFDRYLGPGGTIGQGVVLRPHGSSAVETYPDWAATRTATTRLGLGEVRWWDGTGDLGGTPATGWSRQTWPRVDTPAYGGVALVSGALDTLTGIPPTVWLPAVSRLNAGVWTSDGYSDGVKVRGTAKLHLAVNPSAPRGTVVAYLYDLDALGGGQLITHTPVTWLSTTSTLDATFPAAAYDVPAGHRLALVLDGKDSLYLDMNDTPGATVTYQGSSWLELPTR
ncbi:hypothetical protein Lfu02_76680 [Longispora fulva]|uniref:Xaa-Pro dipeptidyl-peptidase C-terminal domain-containing protein n=1 Tax=Longispora fulva TaxID=619741 RepID=A0A8J7GU23_9ACTN|nr:CocE/NonD family hydrolase [Longispora fulva]MBG6138449.1 hypothetical protein [Longispora fulva]GIG63296.1 hypothetical protein Lfu02_76680 [Longispora fulva]